MLTEDDPVHCAFCGNTHSPRDEHIWDEGEQQVSLKNYVNHEDDLKKEESLNSQYIGQSVWVRGEITEVAADASGLVLVNIETSDDEGEDTDIDVLISVDSEDLKVTDEDNHLIDG